MAKMAKQLLKTHYEKIFEPQNPLFCIKDK